MTAVVIDIGGVPEPQFDDVAAAYADLPLRPPPQEGDNWDGFLVGRTLYRSRYTLLKLARDTTDNSQVVLKFPLPAMAQDQVFRAGFLREAWIGATVRSRWTVGYIDLPPERRRSLYLVMPYYPGQTLEQRLLAQPPIGFAEGVGIALKLCQAVEDLLRLQVVHRDIKPENIILLSDGDLRLLDLGLAFLPGVDSAEGDQLGGTTRYMAPELFKGVIGRPAFGSVFAGRDPVSPVQRRRLSLWPPRGLASGAVASGHSAMVRARAGAGDRHRSRAPLRRSRSLPRSA